MPVFYRQKNRQVQFMPDPNYFGPDELLLMVTDGQYVPWELIPFIWIGQISLWQKFAFNIFNKRRQQKKHVSDICEADTFGLSEVKFDSLRFKSFEYTIVAIFCCLDTFSVSLTKPFCEARLHNSLVVTRSNATN